MSTPTPLFLKFLKSVSTVVCLIWYTIWYIDRIIYSEATHTGAGTGRKHWGIRRPWCSGSSWNALAQANASPILWNENSVQNPIDNGLMTRLPKLTRDGLVGDNKLLSGVDNVVWERLNVMNVSIQKKSLLMAHSLWSVTVATGGN